MSTGFDTFTIEQLDVIIAALDYIQDEPSARDKFRIASDLHAQALHARARVFRRQTTLIGGTDDRQYDWTAD